MKLTAKIYTLAEKTVLLCGMIIFAFLSYIAFRYSIDITNMSIIYDSFIMNSAFVLAVFILLGVLYFLIKRFPVWGKRILLILVCIWCGVICYLWITGAKNSPQGDQYCVYTLAVWSSVNDLKAVVPVDSYLSLYPHQAGIILIYEALIRLFSIKSDLPFQYMNIFYVLLMVVSGYKITEKLFHNLRTTLCFLLLSALCFPFLLYTPFVYGDVPSIGLVFFCGWMLLELIQHLGKLPYMFCFGIPALFSIALAILYRKNSMIFAVACIIVLFTCFLKTHRISLLIMAFVLFVVSSSAIPAAEAFYEHRAENTMGAGVSSFAFVAMGMQEGGAACGWWNGFNSDTYMNANYDSAAEITVSKASIAASIATFKKDPSYFKDFYFNKIVTQWTDPNYSGFYALQNNNGYRSSFAESLFTGTLHDTVMETMDCYQFLIYFFTLLYCIQNLFGKKKRGDNTLAGEIFLVTVIGGFLFTIIWEANSRYTLPYLVMMIPFAASGLAEVQSFISMRLFARANNS